MYILIFIYIYLPIYIHEIKYTYVRCIYWLLPWNAMISPPGLILFVPGVEALAAEASSSRAGDAAG